MNDGVKIKLTYREAIKQPIREALQKDEKVFLIGEDVDRYGGSNKAAVF